MKKIPPFAALIALTAISFQSADAATSACQPPSKVAVMNVAGNCSDPVMPSEIAARSGLSDYVVKACIKVLKEEGVAVSIASGEVCFPTRLDQVPLFSVAHWEEFCLDPAPRGERTSRAVGPSIRAVTELARFGRSPARLVNDPARAVGRSPRFVTRPSRLVNE